MFRIKLTITGESIPIRVFLAGYDLTPTMRDINKKFSVKYFLNLVLMDTEDRRYFKQQEITLWRKGMETILCIKFFSHRNIVVTSVHCTTYLYLGDKIRKNNAHSPSIMAGTQNLQNTAMAHQKSLENSGNNDIINDEDESPEDVVPAVKVWWQQILFI